MITSKHIQYVNRNDKKDVMAIANRSCEQLKRIFGAQNLNLARFTTVIDNIQQRMYHGLDIDSVFISQQIDILLNNLPGVSNLQKHQALESTKTLINATIIMAQHNPNTFKWFRHTQTIKDFIRVLSNKPLATNYLNFLSNRLIGKTPTQSLQPQDPQQLARALKTLHRTISPFFKQFEAANLLNININGYQLMMHSHGILLTKSTPGEMNHVRLYKCYSDGCRDSDFNDLSRVLIEGQEAPLMHNAPFTDRSPYRSLISSNFRVLDTIKQKSEMYKLVMKKINAYFADNNHTGILDLSVSSLFYDDRFPNRHIEDNDHLTTPEINYLLKRLDGSNIKHLDLSGHKQLRQLSSFPINFLIHNDILYKLLDKSEDERLNGKRPLISKKSWDVLHPSSQEYAEVIRSLMKKETLTSKIFENMPLLKTVNLGCRSYREMRRDLTAIGNPTETPLNRKVRKYLGLTNKCEVLISYFAESDLFEVKHENFSVLIPLLKESESLIPESESAFVLRDLDTGMII